MRSLGWCTNPKFRGTKERTFVNKMEFACDRDFFDYWEPRRGIMDSLPFGSANATRMAVRFIWLGAAAGASLLVLFVLTLVTFNTLLARPQLNGNATSPETSPVVSQVLTPTSTPEPQDTKVKIGNTDGLGAWIRPEPDLSSRGLYAWPDGTVLELAGDDKTVDGKLWRNVKDSRGNVGWILKEYLLPAQ